MKECTGNCGICGRCNQQLQVEGQINFVPKTSLPTFFLDVGTTTVVGILVVGNRQDRISFLNPQRMYGADVMSRVQKQIEDGVDMGKLLWDRLFQELTPRLQEEGAGICHIYLSGNTIMQHFLEGLDCKGFMKAPYQAVHLQGRCFTKEKDGVEYVIHMLPGISSLVGADLVSGMLKLGFFETDRISLLIDLGTNGEMVLGNCKKVVVTSTAAGPAFENHPLAMRLHASGLLSLLADMRKKGIVDEYGTMIEPFFHSSYGGMTQEMVRHLQLAKAAICAGCELLVAHYGITYDEVDRVYLAGGMGAFIDCAAVVDVGMLPKELYPKLQIVGNTALAGTISYYEKEKNFAMMDEVRELNLAQLPEFEKIYVERMNL